MREGYLSPSESQIEEQIKAFSGKSDEELDTQFSSDTAIYDRVMDQAGITIDFGPVDAIGGTTSDDKRHALSELIARKAAVTRITNRRAEKAELDRENEEAKEARASRRNAPRLFTPGQVQAMIAGNRANPAPASAMLSEQIAKHFGDQSSGSEFVRRFGQPFAFATDVPLPILLREPRNAIAEADTMRPGTGGTEAQPNIGMLRFPPLSMDVEYYQRRQASVYAFLAGNSRTIPEGFGGAYRYTAETAPGSDKPAPRKPGTALARRKYATEIRTANLQSMGAWVPVAREEFLDVQGFSMFVNTVLRDDVLVEVDEQLITGDGTDPNVRGLLNLTGINTKAMAPGSGDTEFGVSEVHAMMSTIFKTGHTMADFLLFSPDDWHAIRTHRDGENRLQMGSELIDITPSLFGNPVIQTVGMTAGTVFVGTSSKLQMLTQGGISVEWTNAHDDGFANVTDAVRGVIRVGLVSRRNLSHGTVTSFSAEKTGA